LFGSHGDVGGQVVFIDSSVHDLQALLAGIKPGMDVVLLDSQHDALDQIAETLAGHHGISAVHIIADGKSGQIDFSAGALSLGNLTTGSHEQDLSTIGKAMSAQSDLMIWSCDTAQGQAGQSFMDALAHLTGADVAGSTDITGAASLGGDWTLESHTGPIQATVPLTQEGMTHFDSTLGVSLSIIYPTQSVAGAYGNSNEELGFSYGTPGDNVTKDLFPGGTPVPGHTSYQYYNSSEPGSFIALGNSVIFTATTGSDGRELWITDGTSAGTHELDDINGTSGAFGGVSTPVLETVVGSELFFVARTNADGVELWQTNGTTTQIVTDLDPGTASGGPSSMAAFESKLFFNGTDGTTSGTSEFNLVRQLWSTDGTTTTKIFTPTAGGGATYAPSVYDITASGSHLFFNVADGTDGSTSTQLYVSDGTTGGTHLLDSAVTDFDGGARNLTDVNGTLYFTLDDGDSGGGHGGEIWESNGTQTGTFMVADINPGTAGSAPYGFVGTTSGEVFFAANDGTHGTELWETDGTAGNAVMVANIDTAAGAGSDPQDLVAIGNEVYFAATDGSGQELWESNGTTTVAVTTSGHGSTPTNLENVNGTLYWVGVDASSHLGLFKLVGSTPTEVANNYSGLSVGSSLGGFAFIGGGVTTQGEPDAFTTDEATAVTGQNVFNDNGSGPDTGSSLTVSEVNGDSGSVNHQITLASGAHLTLNSDGTFTYDPNGAFDSLPSQTSGGSNTTATDTFTYMLTGASSATTVTITIDGLDSNDTLEGTAGSDNLNPGTGEDTVQALGGADSINMGANLDANDKIDGGTGNDTVNLNGNYAGGNAVTFNATTMVNVENIVLSVGHSYDLTTNDATVAAAQILTVDGSALGSGNSLTFDGSAETDGSFVLIGGAGADTLTGGAGNDVFKMQSGGADTVNGGGGIDIFHFGNTLTAADTVNGGSGADKIVLDGDYTAGNALVLGATTISGVEEIIVTGGFSYTITTNDGNVASGQSLVINASGLGAGDVLTFNGSAENDGSFSINAGAGNDVLTGGAGNDNFNLTQGGNDTAHGGAGNDVFILNGSLTAADAINGGPGNDTVRLSGDYSGGLTFGAATITGVERITLGAGHDYSLTTNSATVATGAALTIYGANLGAGDNLTFNGSSETNGHFNISGGAGDDHLTGGALHDTIAAGDGTNTIKGGGGADSLTGGSGADTFVYSAAADSTGASYDTVHGFDASADFFDTTITVGAIDTTVAAGRLSTANFDTNLAAAVGSGQLGSHDAVLFTPTIGNLAGHTFLVVDINGTAGYQAGQDLVIDVTGMAGTLTTANFI
ncbi:MAG TPA: DUF4347 domain-containing protein, partial [Rhizomicrobium sp.]|nr:DUF4347 domain-containing protein [Rhizomicrobium sp.]